MAILDVPFLKIYAKVICIIIIHNNIKIWAVTMQSKTNIKLSNL